mgnify:CR=1 FL=1
MPSRTDAHVATLDATPGTPPVVQIDLGDPPAVLRPDGLLYVGHSENFNDARALFQLRGKTIYQRT